MRYFQFYFVLVLLVFASCKNEPKTTAAENPTTTESSSENKTTPVNPAPTAKPEEVVPKGSGLVLSGQIADMKGHPIVVSKVGYVQTPPTILAKGSVDESGNFTLNMNPQEKGIYSLKIGNIESLFLLKGNEKALKLNTTAKDYQEFNYSLEGASINKNYVKLMRGAFKKTFTLEQIKAKILNEQEPLLASLVAVQVLRDPNFIGVHQKIAGKLAKDLDVNDALYKKGYAGIISSMINFKKQQEAQKQTKGGIQIGMKAPDLAYNDPTGKIRKLSDLKGKLVLLDFWASWCRPCRKANPNVVRIYKKYKAQGFTVFSVSLDGSKNGDSAEMERGRQKWINAIEKDGLEWPNHVSDLRSWNSAGSAKYGVNSIPATFLIGRDGKIVELEPGRKDLEAIIKKHL